MKILTDKFNKGEHVDWDGLGLPQPQGTIVHSDEKKAKVSMFLWYSNI